MKKYTLDGVFSSIVYRGIAKRLLYQFKYKPYVSDLRDFLVDLTYEGLIQKELFHSLSDAESVIIPIPLYKTKLKKRGYNQSALLAEGLAKRLGLSMLDCLERVRDTHTQVGLTQEKRRENIRDAFRIKRNQEEKLRGIVQVFLVDDIVTSGATLSEAARVLKGVGVKSVWGVTLAHGL